ncbi:protein arginine N-methyltransferase 5 [Anopheles cruzii]|uniref:protein arginine N-methyltransferase 5 n=1 Tax=Anopheles cruzii TaxID=68878 RepID=UPI0022EC3DC9|nr:protein arginine N-methyltransferase 5 [Anopheles cruzii]
MSTDQKPFVAISLHLDTVDELGPEIERAAKANFNSITIPVVHWRFDREFEREPLRTKHQQFTRSDLLLSSTQWLNKIICRIADPVALNSPIERVRKQAERTLSQEISFAQHLMQNGYMYTKLTSETSANFARIVSSVLANGTLLVEVPMVNPTVAQCCWRRDVDGEEPPVADDPWKWWNTFRSHADFNHQVKVALELTVDVPQQGEIYRWMGEPIDAVVLPANVFLTNAKNYPVLSKAHQSIVTFLYRTFSCHFILKANPADGHLVHYVDYIKHILSANYVPDPMQGYDDLLEIPLQPLYDNLDNFTYEVFEKDPVKYIRYQDAIEQALRDRVPDEEAEQKTTIVMVVGGGRGPLVRATLNASVKANRAVKVYVVEKNPNAIVTLTALIDEIWKNRNVELISTDMREFNPPEKADILVSELLGSLGDNELSPECLDGAQRHLKDDGISIPCKSTSYLNPCMASKVYNQVRTLERNPNRKDRVVSSRHMEQTYVAYQKNAYHIDDPQPLFEFVHPNRQQPIDNSRYRVLRFKASLDCVLNGFRGSFDTVLYKDITLSIHPFTHTIGLGSWFSIFVPLTEPVQVKAGQEIVLHFWRCVASHKVWYEWSLGAPAVTHVHNLNGRGHPIWQ